MTMPDGFTLSAERPEDAQEIERLLDLAFGRDRHAKRSYAYRRDVDSVPALRLVARDAGGAPVGTIRYWPIDIERGGKRRPALLLGPLAVEPALKGLGVGRALMRDSLERAREDGHALVLLVGDAAYYAQFGFVPAARLGFEMPFEQPHRLLALALRPRAFGRGGVLRPARGREARRAAARAAARPQLAMA